MIGRTTTRCVPFRSRNSQYRLGASDARSTSCDARSASVRGAVFRSRYDGLATITSHVCAIGLHMSDESLSRLAALKQISKPAGSISDIVSKTDSSKFIRGWRLLYPVSRCGRSVDANDADAEMRRLPAGCCVASATHSSIDSRSFMRSMAYSRYCFPTGVSETCLVVRFTRRTSRSFSSIATPRVTTELDTLSCFAASAKLRHWATVTNIRMEASLFIGMERKSKDPMASYPLSQSARMPASCNRFRQVGIERVQRHACAFPSIRLRTCYLFLQSPTPPGETRASSTIQAMFVKDSHYRAASKTEPIQHRLSDAYATCWRNYKKVYLTDILIGESDTIGFITRP